MKRDSAEKRPRGSRASATAQRREEILAGALRCFLRRGVEATTIEEIRAESGASVGSIYHQFGSKEELAAALYLAAIGDYQRVIVEVLEDAADAEGGVKAVVRRTFEWSRENRDLARFIQIHQPAALQRAIGAELGELNRRFAAEAFGWLRRQAEAGAVRSLPLEVYFALWTGPSMEYLRTWLGRRGSDGSDSEAIEALASAAWVSLKS